MHDVARLKHIEAVVHDAPPSVEYCTLKLVMRAPPSDAGALQVTLAWALPAVTLVGGPGTVHDVDFEGHTYTYLDLDGYAYWSMGAPLDETVVLNRHVVEQSSSEDAAARSESSGRGGQGAPAPSGLGDANAARRLVAAAKPTKKWPEMTDEEKHAFAQGLLAQMKKNVPQKPSGS